MGNINSAMFEAVAAREEALEQSREAEADLFAAIAAKVRGVRKILIASKDKGNHLAVVDILANRIATACGDHTTSFDRDQFCQACGFTYNDQGYSYTDLEGTGNGSV